MKPRPPKAAEKYRDRKGVFKSDRSMGNNGLFDIPGPNGKILTVVISDGFGWDHVSVSTTDRTPTWREMQYIKEIFFDDDETVIQYHPAKKDYVNFHKFCLHLWKPQKVVLPKPPTFMIGPIRR